MVHHVKSNDEVLQNSNEFFINNQFCIHNLFAAYCHTKLFQNTGAYTNSSSLIDFQSVILTLVHHLVFKDFKTLSINSKSLQLNSSELLVIFSCFQLANVTITVSQSFNDVCHQLFIADTILFE